MDHRLALPPLPFAAVHLVSTRSICIFPRQNATCFFINDDLLLLLTSGVRSKKDLYGYLESMGLPRGIFPKGVTSFSFNEDTCKLVVELPGECEVTYADSSVVYYAQAKITARVAVEGLDEIEGIKTKLLFWLPVHSITVDGDKENFYWYVGATRARRCRKHEAQRRLSRSPKMQTSASPSRPAVHTLSNH